MISDSLIIQYKIKLEKFGYVDNEDAPLPITEKLRRLETLQQGWSELKFREETIENLTRQSRHELSGGVLVLLGLSPVSNHLDVIQFGSNLVGDPPTTERWRFPSLGLDRPVLAFSVDPSADLLVLVEGPDTTT